MEVFILAFWFVIALITAGIASDKGRNGFGWFLLSCLLGPIALLAAVLASRGEKSVADAIKIDRQPTTRNCPHCAEAIKPEAQKCRYCSSQVEPAAARCTFCLGLVFFPLKPCDSVEEDALKELPLKKMNPVCRQAMLERGYGSNVE